MSKGSLFSYCVIFQNTYGGQVWGYKYHCTSQTQTLWTYGEVRVRKAHCLHIAPSFKIRIEVELGFIGTFVFLKLRNFELEPQCVGIMIGRWNLCHRKSFILEWNKYFLLSFQFSCFAIIILWRIINFSWYPNDGLCWALFLRIHQFGICMFLKTFRCQLNWFFCTNTTLIMPNEILYPWMEYIFSSKISVFVICHSNCNLWRIISFL